MYKINGENVSPQKLETIITKCPEVQQVEVVGIPHETYGEIGVSFIDAGCPDSTTEQAIMEARGPDSFSPALKPLHNRINLFIAGAAYDVFLRTVKREH